MHMLKRLPIRLILKLLTMYYLQRLLFIMVPFKFLIRWKETVMYIWEEISWIKCPINLFGLYHYNSNYIHYFMWSLFSLKKDY